MSMRNFLDEHICQFTFAAIHHHTLNTLQKKNEKKHDHYIYTYVL